MKLAIASTLFISALIVPPFAAAAEKPEPDVVGNIQVPNLAITEELKKALAAGICRYNGDRIICPYKENEVVLTINGKAVQ